MSAGDAVIRELEADRDAAEREEKDAEASFEAAHAKALEAEMAFQKDPDVALAKKLAAAREAEGLAAMVLAAKRATADQRRREVADAIASREAREAAAAREAELARLRHEADLATYKEKIGPLVEAALEAHATYRLALQTIDDTFADANRAAASLRAAGEIVHDLDEAHRALAIVVAAADPRDARGVVDLVPTLRGDRRPLVEVFAARVLDDPKGHSYATEETLAASRKTIAHHLEARTYLDALRAQSDDLVRAGDVNEIIRRRADGTIDESMVPAPPPGLPSRWQKAREGQGYSDRPVITPDGDLLFGTPIEPPPIEPIANATPDGTSETTTDA